MPQPLNRRFLLRALIIGVSLFGLRQGWLAMSRQPQSPHRFRAPLLYKLVRHPIYLGFTIAFWATPTMTAGQLVFAIVMLGYVLIAIRYEERDLVREVRLAVPRIPEARRRWSLSAAS